MKNNTYKLEIQRDKTRKGILGLTTIMVPNLPPAKRSIGVIETKSIHIIYKLFSFALLHTTNEQNYVPQTTESLIYNIFMF